MLEMIQSIADSRPFHSTILKTNFGIQEAISLFPSEKNLDLKQSLDVEMTLEEEEIRRFKD